MLHVAIFCLIISAGCDSPDENGLRKSDVHDIIHNPATANSNNLSVLAAIEGGPFVYDAGDVEEGDVIRYSFHFTNISKNFLEKIKISSTCGCTVAEFEPGKVSPGAKDSIEVVFDTQGFKGMQEKTVTLIGNTKPKENYFTIKANVK